MSPTNHHLAAAYYNDGVKNTCKIRSLRKYYDEYKDIYLAVNKCKEIRRKLEETKIEYNGEMLAIYAIAQREGI